MVAQSRSTPDTHSNFPPPSAQYMVKLRRHSYLHVAGDTIDRGRYTIRQVVGTGAFGVVYDAVDREGRSYAIKTLFSEEPLFADAKCNKQSQQRKPPRRTLRQRFEEEASAHEAVTGHPSVVRLHRTFIAHGRGYFVFDLYGGGTLLNAITEHGAFWNDDEAITNAFCQLVDAVAHCHSRGVAHRDIKPDNVLVSSNGCSFFLADFGLATAARNCDQFGAGSKHYKSPECIGMEVDCETYDTCVSDVWSLGIILINMITGGHPWTRAHSTDPNFAAYLRDRTHLAAALPLATHATHLITRILEPSPHLRITLAELRVEAAKVGRWGLDDSELPYASESARASVLSYAQRLQLSYTLPPIIRIEPRFPSLAARRSRPEHPPVARQDAQLPSDLPVLGSDTATHQSTSIPTPTSPSLTTSMIIECPVPVHSVKRGKPNSLLRSLRKLKAWGW